MSNPATQFKEGEDPRRNKEGRPKGSISLVTKMREVLDRMYKNTGTKNDEIFIQNIVKDAIKSDGQSRRLLLQYLEGMPKETKNVNLVIPQPLLDALRNNNSGQEDTLPDETN